MMAEGDLCEFRSLSCCPDKVSVEFYIIQIKSRLAKQSMKSNIYLFNEFISLLMK